jgi:hypothetical protein
MTPTLLIIGCIYYKGRISVICAKLCEAKIGQLRGCLSTWEYAFTVKYSRFGTSQAAVNNTISGEDSYLRENHGNIALQLREVELASR